MIFQTLQQKFADEIVHMIGYMGSQQKLQLEGLEQVARFASAEYKAFMSDLYPCLLEQIHQAVAKASLASQWLSDDLAQSNTQHGQLTSLLSSLDSTRVQVCAYLSVQAPKPSKLCFDSGVSLQTSGCHTVFFYTVATAFAGTQCHQFNSNSRT